MCSTGRRSLAILWSTPINREYTDRRFLLSHVRSVVMVFPARLAEVGGFAPPPFTKSTPSTPVTSPPQFPPPLPSETSEQNCSYLYSHISPLYPSLWSTVLCIPSGCFTVILIFCSFFSLSRQVVGEGGSRGSRGSL
jgi:hypothetical protein